MSAVGEELGGTSLDIDVVGLPDIAEFKSEADLFDFDSGNEYGLFGEAGADLQSASGSGSIVSGGSNSFAEACGSKTHYYEESSTSSRGHSLSNSNDIRSCNSSHYIEDATNAGNCSNSLEERTSGATARKNAHLRNSVTGKRKSAWTLMEKDLFQKGLDLIGPNWNKLSRFISSKSPSQIKSYHRKWSETANVIQDSMEDFSVSYVMVPTTSGLDMLLDDPLGILQTAATTTVTTTPLHDDVPQPSDSGCSPAADTESVLQRSDTSDGACGAEEEEDGDLSPCPNASAEVMMQLMNCKKTVKKTAINTSSNEVYRKSPTKSYRRKKRSKPTDRDHAGQTSRFKVSNTISSNYSEKEHENKIDCSSSIAVVHGCSPGSANTEVPASSLLTSGEELRLARLGDPLISTFDDWGIGSHVSVGGAADGAQASSPVPLPQTNNRRKRPKKISTMKNGKQSPIKKLPELSPEKHKRKRATHKNINLLEPKSCPPVLLASNSSFPDDRLSNIEGQVVRLKKDDSTEDSDVDIDVSDDEQLLIVDNCPSDYRSSGSTERVGEGTTPASHTGTDDGCTTTATGTESSSVTTVNPSLNEPLTFSFPPPETELILNSHVISDEERTIHCEYFENRGVKTPERYLKIRNAIIDVWKHSKPNYIGKTCARTSVKNCGDVNSIGKIHEYLEKKGVINFGCSASKYDSPLVIPALSKSRTASDARSKAPRPNVTRQKRNKFRIGLTQGGGLTIRHDDSGAVVDACHIPEAPKYRVSSSSSIRSTNNESKKSEQFKLIKCLEFTSKTDAAPFDVTIHPQAIATMDLHAHSSVAEVMGLMGGYHDPVLQSLHITVAVPTRATTSGVECDMCPVSQSEALERVQEFGVHVVGWYHSHPTFPPNPSLQDVDTQAMYQSWFAKRNSPFVGVIISPFCPTNRTESSHIQCLVLDEPKQAGGGSSSTAGTRSPYKLEWKVSVEKPNKWTDLSKEIREVVSGGKQFGMSVEWRKEWKANLTYWEKAIRSLELLLPGHMTTFVQLVRQAFIAAIKDQMGDR